MMSEKMDAYVGICMALEEEEEFDVIPYEINCLPAAYAMVDKILEFSRFRNELLATSSSSDEGIREENIGNSYDNTSSSMLNGNKYSLNSISENSKTQCQKTILSYQTFVHVSFIGAEKYSAKRVTDSLAFASHYFEIMPVPLWDSLVQSTCCSEIRPYNKFNLNSSATVHIDIGEADGASKSTDTRRSEKNQLSDSLRDTSMSTFPRVNFTTRTFYTEIVPRSDHRRTICPPYEGFEQCAKRKTELCTLRNGSYKTSKLSVDERTKREIVSYLKSSDFIKPDRLDSLNLECEFVLASRYLIRKYPFYFEFLNKWFTHLDFAWHWKFRKIRPRQTTLKRAVIHASKCKNNSIAKINAYLEGRYIT